MIIEERENDSLGEVIHSSSAIDQKQGIGATSCCCCCCTASSVSEVSEECNG